MLDAVDRTAVLQDRENYSYDDNASFDRPVVIAGTNRVLGRTDTSNYIDGDDADAMQTMIEALTERESGFGVDYVDVPEQMAVELSEGKDQLLLRSGNREFMFRESADPRDRQVALRRFSSFCDVPSHLTAKTPAELMHPILQFWYQNKASNLGRVGIVHYSDPDATEGSPTVVDVFKVGDNDDMPWDARVPSPSKIIKVLQESFEKDDDGNATDVVCRLRRYSTSFSSAKGHFMAFELRGREDPQKYDVDFGGDLFRPGINVHARGTGDNAKISIKPMFFRQVCSNGMTVSWEKDDRMDLILEHVNEQLRTRGYATIDKATLTSTAGHEHQKLIDALRTQAFVIFKDNGIEFSLDQFSLDMVAFFIAQSRSALTRTAGQFRSRLASLANPFEYVSHREFMTLVEESAKALRGAIPKGLITLFLKEYAASSVEGMASEKFKSPLDLLNFMTFVAQAYEPQHLTSLEDNVLVFVTNVRDRVADKALVNAQTS